MNTIRLARRCGAATLAAAALAAPAASAADKPVPCSGKLLVTDPAGDQKVGFIGLVESPMAAGPNTDYTGLFINNNGKVTANLVISDLSTKVPADATAIVYRMNFDVGDAAYYVQAIIDSAGTVTYTYGNLDTATAVKDGDTTGALFEGKDGVITIDMPATHGGKPGTKLAGINAFSAYVRGRANTQTDEAPDENGEAAYNGAPCPGGTTAPSAGGGGSTGGGSTGGGSTGGGSTQPPAPGPSSTATAPLKIKAAPARLKLAKARKAKKLTFKLSSQEDLTNVAAAFKQGQKVLGSGKLARLARTGKLTLRLKGKLKKKGSYTLVLTGRRADGSTGTVQLKISVR
jgi:hypothetical protein